jgi:phosphate starvation-inducible protein PhoH and related proteins
MRRVTVPERGAEALFGNRDENLRFMEETLGVRIRNDGPEVLIEGDEKGVHTAEQVFAQLAGMMVEGYQPSSGDVRLATQLLTQDPTTRLRDYLMKSAIRSGRKVVIPRSLNQRAYLEQIDKHDIVFGVGPAGTGKTYLAVAQAVLALNNKAVSRIVLARPAVEAGEKLGFLPGDLQDKVDPYLRPLYDALYDLLDVEKVARLLERNAIEVAPIAFMRGRTLTDSFVIIDEAQNTTPEQMKMVLTRIGFGSKAVITGDITQIDLPQGRTSGLVEAISVLANVKDIAFCYFDDKDVVRHRLVQSIIKAYEARTAAIANAATTNPAR